MLLVFYVIIRVLLLIPFGDLAFIAKIGDVVEFVLLMSLVWFWSWLLRRVERFFFSKAGEEQERNYFRKMCMLLNYYIPMYGIFVHMLVTYSTDYWESGQSDRLGFFHFRMPWGNCSVEKNFTATLINQSFNFTLTQAKLLVDDLPDTTLLSNCNHYCDVIKDMNTSLAASCFHTLENTGFNNWLRYLVFLPVFFVWASVAICIFLTLFHIKSLMQAATYDADFWARHDVVMWIIALPSVYGILSFKAAERCLQVAYNFQDLEVKEEQWKFYAADFAVSDLYEALALVLFGNLTFARITEEHHETLEDMDEQVKKFNLKGKQKNLVDAVLKTSKELYEPMAASTASLLTTCVYGFIFSCIMDATIAIADLLLYENLDSSSYDQISGTMAKAENFMLGFGFVTSSMAIYGVIRIEVAFHEVLDHAHFHAWWKFLSCKLLVSLAFIQQIICFFPLPGLDGAYPRLLTEVESNFLYAACLSMESLLVSLICLKAWRSEETWYGGDEQRNKSVFPQIPYLASVALSGDGGAPSWNSEAQQGLLAEGQRLPSFFRTASEGSGGSGGARGSTRFVRHGTVIEHMCQTATIRTQESAEQDAVSR